MSETQRLEVDCDNIGLRGEGVARHQGMPIFVSNMLPGERAAIRLTERKKTFARGEVLSLLESSPQRIEPACAAFPRCGGCQLQHWDYAAQLHWKKRNIEELFLRHGGFATKVLPVIAAENPWGSRNKVQFPVACVGGVLRLGFYSPRSHDLVPLEECPMQSALANRALRFLARTLPTWVGLTCYDEDRHQGLLRHVLLRTDREDKQLLLTLVLSDDALPQAEEFVVAIRAELPELIGIVLNLNYRRSNTILGLENRLLWGEGEMLDYIEDLRFYVSATSFFQTNRKLNGKLYRVALQQAALSGKETVLEMYCGVGTISAFMARQAKEVIGVELSSQAVRDAKRNARVNGLSNLRFIEGDSETVLPRLLEEGLQPDLVLVDPPRRGCSPELLRAVAAAKIPRLEYISCNPATLVRDAALLRESGYECGPVQPVDMFPWTEHVECCCCFELKK